jgi:hypothetical protein
MVASSQQTGKRRQFTRIHRFEFGSQKIKRGVLND